MMILSITYYLIFSALFYLSYRLGLARLSFHHLNRRALLLMPAGALAIALIAPQFSLNPFNTEEAVFQLPEITIEGQSLSLDSVKHSPLPSSWTFIYLLGLLLSLFYFGLGLYRLYRLTSKAEIEERGTRKLYWSRNIKNAFCFGSYIFIPTHLKGDKDLPLIIEHEIKHQQLGHVWDRLFYRILSIFLWFDPFIHVFARELRQVHEFQVDARVLENKDIEDYAHTLLRSTLGADLQFPETALAPSPFFNSSLIKSRISMMYSNQSKPWRKAIYLLLLPLSFAMMVVACDKNQEPDVVVGVESESRAVSMDQIDVLPITGDCNENSSKEDRKACIMQSIYTHISENFEYPELAKKQGLEGKILVSFVIEKNGEIGEVEIIRSIETEGELDHAARIQAERQATKLVEGIPQFASSAERDGQNVRMRLIVPISLKLT